MAKSRSPKRKSLRKEKHYTVADSISKGFYKKYASRDQKIKHELSKSGLNETYLNLYKSSPTRQIRTDGPKNANR